MTNVISKKKSSMEEIVTESFLKRKNREYEGNPCRSLSDDKEEKLKGYSKNCYHKI